MRKITPAPTACRVCCGDKCKREQRNFALYKEIAQDPNNVIKGLFSHWVEKDRILAMSRLDESYSKTYISEFKLKNIKSVVNLQQSGEHEFCGKILESGFTYNPETLMAERINYFNFPTEDFGVWSPERLLDIVKVLSFALSEGAIAVHCHAGLGRTGVIIAAVLIFENGISAEQSIRQVRSGRAGSIQTRLQLASVVNFEEVLRKLRPWPDKTLSLHYLHRCYKKSYNKHEFGRKIPAPALLLKINQLLEDDEFAENFSDENLALSIKNGSWCLLNKMSCSEVKKLIVSWIEGLPHPLLDYSSSTADEEKLLQSETHRILKNIFKNLGVSNHEADSILAGNSNIE